MLSIEGLLISLLQLAMALFILFPIYSIVQAQVAARFGDNTALRQGLGQYRPLAHVDLLGAFILFASGGFGWTKTPTVNPFQFRNQPQLRHLFVIISGMASFLVLGIVGLIIHGIVYPIIQIELFQIFATLAFGLFIFHLIPLPPLVLYHYVSRFFSNNMRMTFNANEHYAILILVVLTIFFLPLGQLAGAMTSLFAMLLY
jgi:Zn-dependent protease